MYSTASLLLIEWGIPWLFFLQMTIFHWWLGSTAISRVSESVKGEGKKPYKKGILSALKSNFWKVAYTVYLLHPLLLVSHKTDLISLLLLPSPLHQQWCFL